MKLVSSKSQALMSFTTFMGYFNVMNLNEKFQVGAESQGKETSCDGVW